MADIQRHGQARWSGDLLHGSGKISTGSGALKGMAYSVPSRFESGKGTNPEELLAAAHAGCFSMMLAKVLGDQKKSLQAVDTKATLTIGQRAGAWKITTIHLDAEASGDGLDEETLKRAAEQAKEQCPVSLLLKPGLESLTLAVRLKPGA
jgi:lipoyl-dependent peroxiredoxin